MSADTFLKHYGIKGMRWGKRKSQGSTPKLSRRERLEKAYATKYSADVAKKKVDARLRTEKVLAISGAVLVTAAIAVVAGKALHKEFAPLKVAMGTPLQNINVHGDKLNLDKVTFATFKKSDNETYAKKFTEELITGRGAKTVYSTVLKNTEPIKAPSKHQTAKLFNEWSKSRGIDTTKKSWTFNNWNRSMQVSNNYDDPNGFLAYVSSKGYNALQDTLDQNSSNFKAQAPLMIIKGSKTVVTVGSMVVKEILKDN